MYCKRRWLKGTIIVQVSNTLPAVLGALRAVLKDIGPGAQVCDTPAPKCPTTKGQAPPHQCNISDNIFSPDLMT